MTTMQDLSGALPAALVILPLLGAVGALLARSRAPVAGGIGLFASILTASASLTLAVQVTREGAVRQQLGDWDVPLGIGVRADATSAVFLLMTGVVGLAAGIYAGRDGRTTGQGPGAFWPVWLLAWAGMNVVYVAADLFTLYVGLEVLGLAAVGLVALGGRSALGPALRYLLVAVLGSLLYLVVVGIVYGATGTLDMTLAGQRLAAAALPEQTRVVALALAVVGLGLKTALVPLHGWLPSAHASSAPAVSPILSALVIKASFFALLRLWFEVLGPHEGIALVLGLLGAAALGWGGLLALRQNGLKRITAYSTVAQVGYFALVFPLTTGVDAHQARAAWFGMLALLLGHALAKAAMFQTAGSLVLALGDDDVDHVVGAARTFPRLGAALALSAVSLAGLPVSLAFTGKWHLMSAAVASDRWGWVVVLVAATLLSAAYLLRPLAAVLRASDTADAERRVEPRPIPARLQWVPVFLAGAAVVTGVASGWLADLAVVPDPAHPGGAPPAYPTVTETVQDGGRA